MFAVYSVLGIHYALLLCVVLAFWEVVPVIGPTIGFLPTVVAVALDGVDLLHWNRLWQLLFVVIIFNLFQWMKDNVVAPRYIGNVIGLHPVMIFIAIMVGARLDGMAGVICSLPAACVINVLITHQTTRTNARNRNSASLFKNAAANTAAAALVGELEASSIKPSTTC